MLFHNTTLHTPEALLKDGYTLVLVLELIIPGTDNIDYYRSADFLLYC